MSLLVVPKKIRRAYELYYYHLPHALCTPAEQKVMDFVVVLILLLMVYYLRPVFGWIGDVLASITTVRVVMELIKKPVVLLVSLVAAGVSYSQL